MSTSPPSRPVTGESPAREVTTLTWPDEATLSRFGRWRLRRRMARRAYAPEPQHLYAVDRNGKRYTTQVAASRGDWWWGATILTRTAIASLRRDGLLPLTEVTLDERGGR